MFDQHNKHGTVFYVEGRDELIQQDDIDVVILGQLGQEYVHLSDNKDQQVAKEKY